MWPGQIERIHAQRTHIHRTKIVTTMSRSPRAGSTNIWLLHIYYYYLFFFHLNIRMAHFKVEIHFKLLLSETSGISKYIFWNQKIYFEISVVSNKLRRQLFVVLKTKKKKKKAKRKHNLPFPAIKIWISQ